MTSCGRQILSCLIKNGQFLKLKDTSIIAQCRYTTKAKLLPQINYEQPKDTEKFRRSRITEHVTFPPDVTDETVPADFRFVNPDFLPDPMWKRRDSVKERLEREDMYKRRSIMNIPEFYVGSIMAVRVADQYAPNRENRFVGICIDRGETGLKSFFILRNVVDGQGIETMYEMYDPTILSIDVLRLEKRLDNQLYYLRDSAPEHSTFPFDMEPTPVPKGSKVPLNTTRVKLNPRPWQERWERQNLKGVQKIDLPPKFWERKAKFTSPWDKYDMMKWYRENINEDEADVIMQEVHQKKRLQDEKTVLHKRQSFRKNR